MTPLSLVQGQNSSPSTLPNTDEILEEDLISVSFRVYVRGRADYKNLVYFASPGNPEPLDIRYGQKSRTHRYRGLPEFGVFRKIPGTLEQPTTYTEVASIDLTERGSDLLFFLSPAQDRSGQKSFNIAAMESIRSAIQPGTIAFFNGTNATLQGVLASRRLVLPPGLSEPIPTSGIDTGEHVLLGLTVRVEDTLKVVLETNVRFVPNRRTLYVLMPPEQPGSLQINAFRLIDGE